MTAEAVAPDSSLCPGPLFTQLGANPCLGAALQGRRAMEERADEEQEADAEPAAPLLAAAPLASRAMPPEPAHDQSTGLNQRVLQAFIAERVSHTLQERATQAAQQALHARYVRWAQTWLQPEAPSLSARLVSQLLRETERLSTDYQTHPAITQAAHPAKLRLQLLYKLGDELQALQQELREEATNFFGSSRPTGRLELTKKRRGQLRESLLGNA